MRLWQHIPRRPTPQRRRRNARTAPGHLRPRRPPRQATRTHRPGGSKRGQDRNGVRPHFPHFPPSINLSKSECPAMPDRGCSIPPAAVPISPTPSTRRCGRPRVTATVHRVSCRQGDSPTTFEIRPRTRARSPRLRRPAEPLPAARRRRPPGTDIAPSTEGPSARFVRDNLPPAPETPAPSAPAAVQPDRLSNAQWAGVCAQQ
jgi:hypothetical protein